MQSNMRWYVRPGHSPKNSGEILTAYLTARNSKYAVKLFPPFSWGRLQLVLCVNDISEDACNFLLFV